MLVYILDSLLRRTEIVESYESMIWTERFLDNGDFELTIDPRLADTELFTQGTMLGIDRSQRVMKIDTTENALNADGKRLLSVKGLSLEAVLDERPNQQVSPTAGTPPASLVLTGLPGASMRALFDTVCRNNTLMPTDNIQFIEPGEYSPASSIPEPSDSVTIRGELDTLYNTLKSIGDLYHLGFRLICVEDGANHSKLYFEVYSGDDRTSGQVTNDVVAFGGELDNLADTKELISTAAMKNVAYVFNDVGSRVVYADGFDDTVSGTDRKVLLVNASDLNDLSGAPLNDALDQLGREELAKYRVVIGFDGEIPKTSQYIYGVHYNLGDIVEQRGESGIMSRMRVTEQIFVSDAEGDREYPTLTLDSLVAPGTWYSIPGNKLWYDYTTQLWVDM